MGTRRQREHAFRSARGARAGHLSADLIWSASRLFELALRDRRRGVHCERDNHFSSHAIGSVLLLVSGLEAWLNETIAWCAHMHPELVPLALKPPISARIAGLAPQSAGDVRAAAELAIVVDVRNEAAHFLPLSFPTRVPSWLEELEKRGLLISLRSAQGEYQFSQRLPSYKLAVWCWTVVERAANELVERMPDAAAGFSRGLLRHFSLYDNLPRGAHLASYDEAYDIGLTPVPDLSQL